MKVTNFKLKSVTGSHTTNYRYVAEITIETGFWFFKKTETVEITRRHVSNWIFITGWRCGNKAPQSLLKGLEEAYLAEQGVCELHEVKCVK